MNLEGERECNMEEICKEIAVLGQCESKNITRYRGSLLVGSELWIIMDYCGLGSLFHIIVR